MRKLVLIAFAVVLTTLTFRTALAQGGNTPPTLQEIQRMVDSATTTDPEIERYLPRWRIQEADLKIKIAQYFKLEGIPVRETDSMIVTATFERPGIEQEILSIRVGPRAVLSGAQKIRGDLGEALYEQIRARTYAHTVIPPATPLSEDNKERIGNVMQPANARQFVAASAFRQAVQIGTTGARLEHLLGNDEIGYHFWSSGQGKGVVTYPIIRLTDPELRRLGVPDILTIMLGAAYRMKFGTPQDEFLGGVISPRKLNGAIGTKAVARVEYRLPQLNDIGFAVHTEIPFNKMTDFQTVNMSEGAVVGFAEPGARRGDSVTGAYFLRTIAQGNVFWETWLNDYEHFFRISLGVSYQEVARGEFARLDNIGRPVSVPFGEEDQNNLPTGIRYTGLTHPTEFEDWILAKVEYLNQSGFPFGATAQLANRNLLLTGFIPVIPNWLFIEAKYSTPILRDQPAPWEQRSFFMISPILRFQIDAD